MAGIPVRLFAHEDLTRRALAAYFRSGGEFAWPMDVKPRSAAQRADPRSMLPSMHMSGLVFHNDKAYIVLRNNYKMLAVYRVRNDGILKRLRRWPKAVEDL